MMGMMGRMMVAVVSGVKVVELSVERPTIGGKPESGGCLSSILSCPTYAPTSEPNHATPGEPQGDPQEPEQGEGGGGGGGEEPGGGGGEEGGEGGGGGGGGGGGPAFSARRRLAKTGE